MDIGMMWFDPDPKTALDEKVLRAAAYFRAKYGKPPNACRVNPAMMTDAERVAGPVTVRPWRSILPGTLWIGVEESTLQVC